MKTESARLTVDISKSFRDELRQHAVSQGVSIKEFVVSALIDRIHRDTVNEDDVWGELADHAKSEGLASDGEVNALLNAIDNA